MSTTPLPYPLLTAEDLALLAEFKNNINNISNYDFEAVSIDVNRKFPNDKIATDIYLKTLKKCINMSKNIKLVVDAVVFVKYWKNLVAKFLKRHRAAFFPENIDSGEISAESLSSVLSDLQSSMPQVYGK